jgi:hypothetical protein
MCWAVLQACEEIGKLVGIGTRQQAHPLTARICLLTGHSLTVLAARNVACHMN